MHHVYQIELVSTGKKYIGCSTDPKQRLYHHARAPFAIGDALRAGGTDNCTLTVLESHEDHAHAMQRETQLIKEIGTMHPKGYNMKNGGGGMRTGEYHPRYDIDTALLCEMYARGDTSKEISNHFGLSWKACFDRLKREGVQIRGMGRKWNKPDDAQAIKEDRENGMIIADIMAKYNLSRDTVYRRLKA